MTDDRAHQIEAFAQYVRPYLLKGDKVVVTPEGLSVGPFVVAFDNYSVVLEMVGADDPDDTLPVYQEFELVGVSPLTFLSRELEHRFEARERIKAKLREKFKI